MNVTLAVYQSRTPGGVRWITLGLGPQTRSRVGKNAARLQRRIVDDVRAAIGGATAADLALFRMPQGLRLERVRLELSLRGRAGHRRASGLFPLVLETRWRTAREAMTVAYHPERQDEWFPVRDDQPLDAQASAWFSHAWADLEPEAIGPLQSDRRDGLRIVSFEAQPKTLLERLGKKKGPWDDLEPVGKDAKPRKKGRHKVLDRLGTNLTQQAIEGVLEGGMPRAPYREQLELLLGGATKTPVLLVGPPGVGKRTLLARFVVDRLEGDGWSLHRNLDRIHEVWSVAGKRIIAGMSYVGDWEQRCLELLEDCTATPGRRILVVEDLHAFGRIGRSRESDANLALFFQGPLSRGELALAGACTPEQLQRLEDEAPSFAALFTVLTVHPASLDETTRMVVHEARRLERRHFVSFEPATYPDLVEQTGALWGASAYPGCALRTLRQLAADYAHGYVAADEVLGHLSAETGLPDFVIDRSYGMVVKDLEADFAGRVMGQPEAARACTELVLKIRTGLTDPRRPWGALLFAGPTGTGKTELAKALAANLYGEESRLLRFDMSEYQGPDAAARLCGDAWDPEGALVRAVRAQPFCVVLLDEVEKAHPSALHLLLQLLDEGRLSDAAGETADFRHAVVVMTSNLGASAREAVGFGEAGAEDARLDSDRAVRAFFPPELFNRIDRIVHFRPLDAAVAERVAQKELARLLARPGLSSRNVFVTVADEVRALAVREAFDARMGARSVKRWLEEQVGGRLSEALLAAPAAPMRRAEVWVRHGALAVDVEALVTREPTPGVLTLEPCLKAGTAELLGELRSARARLEALARGDALARLDERLRFHLAHLAGGRGAHGDAAYALDAVRQSVEDLAARAEALLASPEDHAAERLEVERFGTLERSSRATEDVRVVRVLDRRALARAEAAPTRARVLDALAEIAFLERTLPSAGDLARHAATIEIARFGAARSNAWDDFALIRSLAKAYAAARGTVEGFAARLVDGRIVEEGPGADLEKSLARGESIDELVLRMAGLSAFDFFEGEHGLHVWRTLGKLPQLLQIRVRPGDAPPPRAVLEERRQQRAAFKAARAAGEACADPDAPLPTVRVYRFDAPYVTAAAGALEVEDYELGWATAMRGKGVLDALPDLFRLRMSRAAPAGARAAAGEGAA